MKIHQGNEQIDVLNSFDIDRDYLLSDSGQLLLKQREWTQNIYWFLPGEPFIVNVFLKPESAKYAVEEPLQSLFHTQLKVFGHQIYVAHLINPVESATLE